MNKSDVAREYRTKFPEMATAKLARVMYDKNRLLFKDEEAARFILRYIEGKTGDRRKKHVAQKQFIKDEPRPYNPYKLPESDETKFEPYVLKGHKRVAIFADVHIPYHSIAALTAAIDYVRKEKPDALILNGDALDFHGLSRFQKDPRKKKFSEELETWRKMFDAFSKALNCKIYYKIGNHEERYEHYLWMKAGELAGVEEFELTSLLQSRAKGIEVISDKQIIKAGGLNIIHGHEFGGSIFSPVNIARGLYLKGKVSAIQGHNHQVSEHTEPDMNGKIVTTWSLGCLCELHPAYLPINKWAHGFALVDIDGSDFMVRNKRIWKGKIM
jgi:predicted phosphodiesterase